MMVHAIEPPISLKEGEFDTGRSVIVYLNIVMVYQNLFSQSSLANYLGGKGIRVEEYQLNGLICLIFNTLKLSMFN